jgi:hypothetical protein
VTRPAGPEGGLAARQRALVAALVAGGPVPEGLDPDRLAAGERALRAKRAGEVTAAWPLLARTPRFADRFAGWARGRSPRGALRDGWDLARELAAAGELPGSARAELAGREVRLRYDGERDPRSRRLPAARRVPGGLLVAAPGLGTRLLPLRVTRRRDSG